MAPSQHDQGTIAVKDTGERPYPVPDIVTAPFWEGATEGKFRLQFCPRCSAYLFYPRPLCYGCGREELRWVDVPTDGTIYSYTIIHRAAEQYQSETPFVVVIVDLDIGVRLTTRLVGVPLTAVCVGMPVHITVTGNPSLPYVAQPRNAVR